LGRKVIFDKGISAVYGGMLLMPDLAIENKGRLMLLRRPFYKS